ncbi:MAG: DMT family transporter [Pseudonocardiaceae bacterium]
MLWHLAHKPVWFAGIGAIIVGFVLQAGALATGPITLVQPILVLELGFTLLLAAAVFHSRLPAREWSAVGGMTAGLALLLYSLSPSGGHRRAASPTLWAIAITVTLALAGLFVALGYRRHHARRAAYFGVATGVGFGLIASLVAGITTAYAGGGLGGVFTAWQTYLVIVLGPSFFFLLQKTMQAGRLVAAQPPLTLANPIVAFGIGITVFGEHVRKGGWAAGAAIGAVLIAGCTVRLARSPLLADQGGDPAHGRPDR